MTVLRQPRDLLLPRLVAESEASQKADAAPDVETASLLLLHIGINPGLQAVDFVAWAIRRKYEGNGAWAELIQDRVVAEELIRGKKIAALPGGR